MSETTLEFYQRRLKEEIAKSELAPSADVKHVNMAMADMYRARIREIQGRPPRTKLFLAYSRPC